MPLATALCKNLAAENTQRQLSRPKPTRVAVPIEEEWHDKKQNGNLQVKKYLNNVLFLWAGKVYSVLLATGWTVRGSNPGVDEILRSHPARPWGPPISLYNRYLISSWW